MATLQERLYRPTLRGFCWQRYGDWGLPHLEFWTDWWSFRLTFCCQSWGFTLCYFALSQRYYALETGYAVWGRQALDEGGSPVVLDSWFYRVSARDFV